MSRLDRAIGMWAISALALMVAFALLWTYTYFAYDFPGNLDETYLVYFTSLGCTMGGSFLMALLEYLFS